MSDLARTPLDGWHAEQGGRLVDFAGWSMPVQYTSIVEEHVATRSSAGLFDISHMGRIQFEGSDACRFLDQLLTRRITDLPPGSIRYSLVTDARGGILDDVLAYRLPSEPATYMLVVNASNRVKILEWLRQQYDGADQRYDVQWTDTTLETAMIAVQGPRALEITQPLVSRTRLENLRYYNCAQDQIGGAAALVSRTGYTGEDGCELIVPAEHGLAIWQAIVASGTPLGMVPAGLGARDTLRLEAGMPLYGHELSEEINPYEAELSFAVQLKGRHFVGREALASISQNSLKRKRIGLALEGRRVPREGYTVLADGQPVGQVTSGTFSPTLEYPIAMAYVAPKYATPGHALAIDIRGRQEPATVVRLPFYRRMAPSESQ